MSLLPALFRRGERLRPLGTARKPEIAEAKAQAPTNDWRFSTPSDSPPKRVRLRLTDAAEAEADDFRLTQEDRCCVCFTGCAPCGWCTHPGNPLNLAEDDSAWVMGYEAADYPHEGRAEGVGMADPYKLETYRALLKEHDWWYEYSDSRATWFRGREARERLLHFAKELDPDFSIWNQSAPEVFKLKAPA